MILANQKPPFLNSSDKQDSGCAMNKQENSITPEVKQALVSVSLLSAFILVMSSIFGGIFLSLWRWRFMEWTASIEGSKGNDLLPPQFTDGSHPAINKTRIFQRSWPCSIQENATHALVWSGCICLYGHFPLSHQLLLTSLRTMDPKYISIYLPALDPDEAEALSDSEVKQRWLPRIFNTMICCISYWVKYWLSKSSLLYHSSTWFNGEWEKFSTFDSVVF